MELYYFFIAAYMLFGLWCFEWAWAKCKPIREVNEARDSQYPAYRRVEAMHWRKWKFYFGALTWMPIRMFVGFGIFFLLYLWVK